MQNSVKKAYQVNYRIELLYGVVPGSDEVVIYVIHGDNVIGHFVGTRQFCIERAYHLMGR